MSKKKISVGVLNCQHLDNYGAVLVAYSLQEALKQLDTDVKIINYQPIAEKKAEKNFLYYIKKIKSFGIRKGCGRAINKVRTKLNDRKKNKFKYLDSAAFEDWRRRYLIRTEKVYNQNSHIEEFDCIIEGSDVVWKPGRLISDEQDMYLLNCIDKNIVKATYAASIGTNEENELNKIVNLMKENIDSYQYISLREKSSVEFVKKCTEKTINVCIDPTFLILASDYIKILPKSDFKQKYILFYYLGGNSEAIEFVNLMSKKLNLGVIHANTYEVNKKIKNSIGTYADDDPGEFLAKIYNAELIITNSFHGTVFSLIFNKPFYTLSRNNISIRMTDLLGLFDLSNRFIMGVDDKSKEYNDIDFRKVNDIIKSEREKGIQYLEKIIDEVGKRVE